MKRLLHLFALIAFACSLSVAPVRAEQQDVAAIARGVVRVVIIATNGQEAYFVGHGSGFAVAPDKVLTNAHVVELLRTEKNLVIGIIPSEGKRSYGGKVIAYSPGNDLALIKLTNGQLPVATFFAGAPTDGQHVTAIGYPASVDRAQGLDMAEMVQPLTPVKTSGTVSTGRASHGFDTVLHTAPMAEGNSGGPLVDDCGRVLGVNSFGSQSESEADAAFGFAVSNREVASFLRQAGVQFQRTMFPCRSIAELDAEEARRKQEEQAQKQQRDQAALEVRDRAIAQAREQAEQQIYSSRENAMALAAILLVMGGLSLGGAMMFHLQGRERQRLWTLIAGGVLLTGAAAVFFLRPSFSGIDERMSSYPIGNAMNASLAADGNVAGGRLCHIDETRSRVTVSGTDNVHLNWTPGGCVNGQTQYLQQGDEWIRILAPDGEETVSVGSFNPTTGVYKVDRYLPDSDVMDRMRALRAHATANGCTTDAAALTRLAQSQSEMRSALPAQPNERLVYRCSGPAAPAAAQKGAQN